MPLLILLFLLSASPIVTFSANVSHLLQDNQPLPPQHSNLSRRPSKHFIALRLFSAGPQAEQPLDPSAPSFVSQSTTDTDQSQLARKYVGARLELNG